MDKILLARNTCMLNILLHRHNLRNVWTQLSHRTSDMGIHNMWFSPGKSSSLAPMEDKPWQSAVSATISKASRCMAILIASWRTNAQFSEVRKGKWTDLTCHSLADVEELLADEAANLR